ncbi:hypothetical protein QBC35DRAFT_553579 [Podospora australis]|uniref:Uncharacterized protein n=1 Tax=Podospora australis TaxID=1536484 RepID=A0AAN6X298_9PEZI|nr:hypothetical protein QBC35DRAFT_553579 [Podospora australis]
MKLLTILLLLPQTILLASASPHPQITSLPAAEYAGRCANIWSETKTVVSSPIFWAPQTEMTIINTRTVTTLFENGYEYRPTPTAAVVYPTYLVNTVIWSETEVYHMTFSDGHSAVSTIVPAVVSYSYTSTVKGRYTGAPCKVVG